MTQEKIKIVDYSNYDKLFEDYQKRKPDFEKFKQEAQKVLDHPEVDEDYKNHVRTLLNGLDKFTNGIGGTLFQVNKLILINRLRL